MRERPLSMPEVPEAETLRDGFTGVEIDVLWTALAHAHDSVIVYERPRAGSRPRIVYVNEATVRQSGFSRHELLSGSTGTGPLTDAATVRALRDAMLRGEPMRVRLALYRKDGSTYWGEIDGRPVRDRNGEVRHWISIERDISDAVERERALAALLDASRSLFGVLDSAALDAAFLRALRSVLDLQAAFSDDPADPLVARAIADGGAVADGRGRFAVALHAAGRDPRVALATCDPDRPPNPNALTVLALLAQTYTAAARNAALFDEVHRQRAAVLELSRMKGDLVTMLAHDLNNPLTAIRGFAELLGEQRRDDIDGVQATDAIIRATERLLDLGKETLALARLEDNALVLVRAPIDYGVMIAHIALELSPAVDVVVDGEAGGTGDPVLIRGMCENVVGNAVKYSPPGATVRVRVRAERENVVIEVHDRGIGIPRNEIGGVFDRFGRASNAREADIPGTGFGLYFVRLVVQRHGGTIAIDSDLDRGTSVVITMPREPPVTSPPGVVVLERGEPAASYTEHVLRDAGYRVHMVRDLEAFEDALRGDPTLIAVVPEGAHEALESARAAQVRIVELRRPYLARELLRALADAV